MEKSYHQNFNIPCYDTDAGQMLKPVSFMNYAQEIANCHASVLGFGYDDMILTRTAWVLSRMHIIFRELPKWRDNVNLRTWHKGPERLFYIRDYRMTDAEDKRELAVATTSWLVLNIDSRRLVREPLLDEGSICKEDAISPSCDKIRIPDGLVTDFATEHHISYSDIDLNGHANNAMYLLWSMDAVGNDVTLSRHLKEVKINFNHEAKAGNCVEIHVGKSAEGGDLRYWVEGRLRDAEDKSSFVAELLF